MTLHVPMITPFDDRDRVALGALEQLANDALDGGATGLVALGTTGEPGSLSGAEQRAVVDVLASATAARSADLVIGANTMDAVRALENGPATAALSLVPPFLRPGEEGTMAHFTALAAASSVPVIVYHVPYRTGQVLIAAALRRLADIPGVAGIKLATGSIDAGFGELIRAWHTGAAGRARQLGHRLSGLSAALFAEPNPTVIKGVLHAQGRIPTAAVRLPLLPAGTVSVATALQRYQELDRNDRSPSISRSTSSSLV